MRAWGGGIGEDGGQVAGRTKCLPDYTDGDVGG